MSDEPSAIEIFALFTTCETAAEVLALKLASPLYVAVMEWVATDSDEVASVATPPESVLVASAVPPSKKVTVPVGVPTPDVVVAVKVTEVPNVDGFNDEPNAIVTFALFTTCDIAAEVDALKLVSPLYIAVMEWVATDSDEVASVATPLVMVLVAIDTPPSLKVTVPDGVPTPDVVVAVKVTEVPNVDGFNEEPSAMATFALLTVCDNAAEVLALKLVSPLYTAVMEWVVTDNDEVAKVATPPVIVLVASVVPPSLKVTVPVGVPAPEVVVAVKVTDCPKFDGFNDEPSAIATFALLTVNVCAVDVPPPGVGLNAVILNVPTVVRSDAGMVACKVVALSTVVTRSLPLNCNTVLPVMKFVPVAYIVNPDPLTVADVGEMLVNVGVGYFAVNVGCEAILVSAPESSNRDVVVAV